MNYDTELFRKVAKWWLFPVPARLRGWQAYKKGLFFVIATLYRSDWEFSKIKQRVGDLVKRFK